MLYKRLSIREDDYILQWRQRGILQLVLHLWLISNGSRTEFWWGSHHGFANGQNSVDLQGAVQSRAFACLPNFSSPTQKIYILRTPPHPISIAGYS